MSGAANPETVRECIVCNALECLANEPENPSRGPFTDVENAVLAAYVAGLVDGFRSISTERKHERLCPTHRLPIDAAVGK